MPISHIKALVGKPAFDALDARYAATSTEPS
jgi:hypothetical protein